MPMTENTTSLSGLSGLVTVKEASRVLRVTPWQVRYYIKQHRIPIARFGRMVLVPLKALDDLAVKAAKSQ